MTAVSVPSSSSASRRALLAGVLGGIGAWAAGAAARVSPVHAEGETVVVGGEYTTATSATKLRNQTNNDDVLWGDSAGTGRGVTGISNGYIGVYGSSDSHTAVYGISSSGRGVQGTSSSSFGVYGVSQALDQPASVGWTEGNSTGVQGYSGSGNLVPPKAKTGVYGFANQDSLAKGVWGDSPMGHAVQGTSSSGWAGYFAGRVFVERYQEFEEVGSTPAPGANRLRLFARDNGSGKTQLCVRFATGSVRVLATQP